MQKRLDIIGKRFGKLVVLRLAENQDNYHTKFTCQCDCGTIKDIPGVNLTRKKKGVKSCGCGLSKIRYDLIGKRFGRFVVLKVADKQFGHNTRFTCQCDCGNIKDVCGTSLTSGNTTSCGCKNAERFDKIHGATNVWAKRNRPLYRAWYAMLYRCENPQYKDFHNYGGRGITVCEEWHIIDNFCAWALDNGYKKGLQLDRIDNESGYKPDNCRWVTSVVQQNNKRTTKHVLGKTISWWAAQHCDARWFPIECIIKRIHRRFKLGWEKEDAVRVSFNLERNIITSFLDDYYPELVEVLYPSPKNLVDNFVEGGLC